jgi:O-antigen/teichoic acid export membrane protein
VADASRSQIRGSALLLAGQAFTLVVNLTAQVLIARHLSKGDFGAFAFALSVVTLGEMIAAFGLKRGVSRFVPIYEERGELAKAAGTLVFAFATVVWIGASVVLVVSGLSGLITGSLDSGSAEMVLTILIVLAPIQALENLLDGAFAVLAKPRAIVLRKHVYSPLMRFLVVAALVAAGQDAEFLAYGWVATGFLGLAIYGSMLGRALRARGIVLRGVEMPMREILRFTVPLLSNDASGAIMNAAGTLILGALATAADVADLRVVFPIALTMNYVLNAFGLLFVPLASRLYARGDTEELSTLYWRTAAWTSVLSFPVLLISIGFGDELSALLFGERYRGSGDLLAILVLGYFLSAATGPNGTLLGVYHRTTYLLWTNVAAVAVNLVLCFVLIAAFDALGAAIAVAGTQAVLQLGRQVGLGRRTDVTSLDRDYVGLYALLAVAAAAVFAFGLIVDPPFLVGLVVVALVSAGVLVVSKRRLAFAETFPELARLPGVRRVLG